MITSLLYVPWDRKLSGAFLLAARLDAKVNCRDLWERIVDGYQFSEHP